MITTSTLVPVPSVVIGIPDANYNLNPLSGNDSLSQRIVGNAVWANVYDIDPDTWERIPDVVLALPSQSANGVEHNADGSMTVRYQVHPDARWSDGIRITGADIAFTAEVMRDLALAGSSAVDPIMGTVTRVDHAQNVGWITFSEQSLAFEEALWVLLPSHVVDPFEIEENDGFNWPSGGPFVGVGGTRGRELVANPNYWKTDDQGRSLPLIHSVTIVADPTNLPDRFNAGSIDVFEVDGFEVSAVDLSASDAALQKVPSPLLEQLTFNFRASREAANPDSLNSISDFRLAIAHSIDPSIYVGDALVYFSGGPPGVLKPRDGSEWAGFAFNTPKAKGLVDGIESGDSPGATSVINTTGNSDLRIDVTDALVPGFAQSGVTLTPEYVDSVVLFGDVLPAGTFDIGMWAWVNDGGYRATIGLLDRFDPAGRTDAYGGWGEGSAANDATRRFSEIVAQASGVTTAAAFKALVDEAEAILASELPIVPLFQRASHLAVWGNRISGVRHNATSSTFTWNIEVWEATNG